MKNSTYDYVWNQIIWKSIDDLLRGISKEDINKYQLRVKEQSLLKRDIRREYEKIKRVLKSKYYNGGENKNNLIDSHKIAACFCCSLINNKAFIFEITRDISFEIFFINYKLAYNVSIGIIYLYLAEYYDSCEKNDIGNKLRSMGTLSFPKTSEGHDSYSMGRIKTLALNDIYGNQFDLLTYSDMLFWIELYNKQLLENI